MEIVVEKRTILFTLGEVGEILGSISEGDPGFHRIPIYGISTDSRTTRGNELFVAIKGESYDGHAFLAQALSKGAVAAVVSKVEAERMGLKGPEYITVDDTLFALGELARRYRARAAAKVTAVTGSNGKTTVKNLVFEIISRRDPAIKSLGNFNNLIGLPISIFQIRDHHKYAVFELGMSARGEISRLGQIASPDVGIITNVGPVHLEFLKSLDEVAEAKLELLQHIRSSGTLVVNGDDQMLNSRLHRYSGQILKFGLERGNDVRPSDLSFDSSQMPRFSLKRQAFSLQIPGIHNLYNALAAYAASIALGIDKEIAAEAINSFRPEALRSEIIDLNGISLVVDCYNANPVSMSFAIEMLSRMNCRGRRIAVLGDMLELGEQSVGFHEEIGDQARELKIDFLFAFGPLSHNIVGHFGLNGRHFEDKQKLSKSLIETIKTGDIILFKGSRGMALEEVVEEVKKTL
jgi:UDP-N-acetylmuramoyl-tripeptide--D-alanyl-D-alanine ligase